MTPQPPTVHIAVPAHRRRLVRRTATVLAAIVAVGGTPLVAAALGGSDEPTSAVTELAATSDAGSSWAPTDRGPDTPPSQVAELESGALELDARAELAVAERAAELAAERAADAEAAAQAAAEAAHAEAVAGALVALADTYQWDERSLRVALLQQTLGVEDDGWYAWATLRAHRGALEAAGMATDALPVPPAPTPVVVSSVSGGPSASAWAALRNCESGGSYSITNPSGKYRGAYQFDQSTWNSVAGRHAPGLVGVDPAAASPSSQDAMARALYSERGSDPWPQCGRHL